MEDPDDRIVQYDQLNLLGKTVFLAGAAARAAASVIEAGLSRAADIAVEAERAFKQGLDPNIEDAVILEERFDEEDEARRPPRRP